jgi:hypothetical protein
MTARTDTPRLRLTRLLAGIGGAWGLTLLVQPRPVVDALCPEFPADRLWVVRLLGARLVAQHAVVLATPGGPVVRATTAVELVHAASMALFVRSARYGRAARISGATAAVYAALVPAVVPRSERR